MSAATLVDLLDVLGHRHDERISVCHRLPGGQFTAAVVPVGQADDVVATHVERADVWFGVNPVNPTAGRGTVDAVTRWAALYADLDVKPGGMSSLDAAQLVIDELAALLGARPVAVTFSGHGLQPYWALDPDDTDTDLTDPHRRAAAQATLRRFGRLVAVVAERYGGAVDSVFDLTRVLRAPGTVNRKGTPVSVVTSLMSGAPLTVEQVADALDAYGIPTFVGDDDAPGDQVSNPGDWTWAGMTCGYARNMVSGWATDRPTARHPWLMSQATRLEAARRNGCLTHEDYLRARQSLDQRMEFLLATVDPVRPMGLGELHDAHSWATAHVAAMTDDRVRRELGNHPHSTPLQPLTSVLPNLHVVRPDDTPQDAPVAASDDDKPSWARIDLTQFLDGSFVPQVPEMLVRTDGVCLVYAGRVHSFHGESESGKSWVGLALIADKLATGLDVLMIDFESDAHTVVGRLLRMGVPPEAIRDHFDYRRPEVSPDSLAAEHLAWLDLLTHRYAVILLDGVTEALAVFGVPSKDNDEITGWIRRVPRKIAQTTGGAVILVDHVTKDADSRGRFAIGGQAKMAALDGAAYVVEVLDPLGVGLVGRVALRVAKDRPGGVRPHSGPFRKSDRTQEAAVVVIDSTEEGVTRVRVDPPREGIAADPEERKPFRPTALMERVSRAMELANACMSRNAIASAVTGKREYIMQAIDCLETDGFLVADGPALNGGRPSLRLVNPYREGRQPVPELTAFNPTPETDESTRTRSRSKDRGTGERVRVSSNPVPQEHVGTGREHLGFDPRTGEIRDE